MIEPLGTQLWADMRWRDGWRVQRRWSGDLARVVDPAGRRVYRGRPAECERFLARSAPEPTQAAHLVVLLHGLGRTRRSLAGLDEALRGAGFTTARLDYPSTRRTIEEHASVVAELLDHLPTPDSLSFVGHSLGALITRQLFGYDRPWRASAARVAMLAPPNQGASLAASLDKAGVLRTVLGPSFGQIADGVAARLPIPSAPFAIFAGNALGASGDGLLRVEETRLDGMQEHVVVPAIHTFIMDHPDVIRGVLSFLRTAPDGG
jgi:hypothetical protein